MKVTGFNNRFFEKSCCFGLAPRIFQIVRNEEGQ